MTMTSETTIAAAARGPAKKQPNPIDVHIGSRVRLRRMMLGMSQEKLGDALGITFQQVQKYEKGTNRISGSRMVQIARILKVPVVFFFEDAPGLPDTPGSSPGAIGENDDAKLFAEFLGSSEGVRLNRGFLAIRSARLRGIVVRLVDELSGRAEERAVA